MKKKQIKVENQTTIHLKYLVLKPLEIVKGIEEGKTLFIAYDSYEEAEKNSNNGKFEIYNISFVEKNKM